ncbi:MAG: hypothetical protein LWW76_04375 [Burkholderiales bacterium]|nr:hypothetical protein [Burkholderiales bacterium]
MNMDKIVEFTRFLEKELNPAISEVESLTDNNRKHIQKLVFTNLVDRFDFMVDKFLLENCQETALLEKALAESKDTVTESYLITLLLQSNDLQSVLNNKIQDKLRLTILRQRHSRKLATLLSLFFESTSEYERKPRINPSTGDILDNFKIQRKEIPASICGYADWLYSRRNAIVHGAGASSITPQDRDQIDKIYKVKVSDRIKISVASVKTAVKFYQKLCDLLLNK